MKFLKWTESTNLNGKLHPKIKFDRDSFIATSSLSFNKKSNNNNVSTKDDRDCDLLFFRDFISGDGDGDRLKVSELAVNVD